LNVLFSSWILTSTFIGVVFRNLAKLFRRREGILRFSFFSPKILNNLHVVTSNNFLLLIICLLGLPARVNAVIIFSINVGRPIWNAYEDLALEVRFVNPDFVFLQEVHVNSSSKSRLKKRLEKAFPDYVAILALVNKSLAKDHGGIIVLHRRIISQQIIKQDISKDCRYISLHISLNQGILLLYNIYGPASGDKDSNIFFQEPDFR